MIKEVTRKPAHGMQFIPLTPEEKRGLLKQYVKRVFRALFSSNTFWLIQGYIIGSLCTGYVIVNALHEIDKLIVCK